MTQKSTKRGPSPERIKLYGPWEDAFKQSLSKPRPADGWPGQQPKPKPDKATYGKSGGKAKGKATKARKRQGG